MMVKSSEFKHSPADDGLRSTDTRGSTSQWP